MYWLCSIKWWINYREKILKLFIKVKILFNSKKLFILIRYVPINLYVLPQKYNARLEQISGQNNYSETLELSSLTKPNRIKHEFVGSELFQYFDAFSSSVWSNRTLFYCIWMNLSGSSDWPDRKWARRVRWGSRRGRRRARFGVCSWGARRCIGTRLGGRFALTGWSDSSARLWSWGSRRCRRRRGSGWGRVGLGRRWTG